MKAEDDGDDDDENGEDGNENDEGNRIDSSIWKQNFNQKTKEAFSCRCCTNSDP